MEYLSMDCIVLVEESYRFLCREQIVVVVVVAQMEDLHSHLHLGQSDEAGGEKRAFWSCLPVH
jgi:hypothetical protein